MDKGVKTSWKSYWSFRVVLLYALVALLAPVISNDLPLLRMKDGKLTFPFLSKEQLYNSSGKRVVDAFEIHALFAYGTGKNDALNTGFKSPFEEQFVLNEAGEKVKAPLSKRHWLGTNLLGSDLLADILYGSRWSFFISIVSTLLASIVALFFGFLAGWYGPDSVKVSSFKCFLALLLLLYAIHVSFNLMEVSERVVGWLVIFLFWYLLYKFSLSKMSDQIFQHSISIPVDSFFLRFTELFSAIPRVILVLAFYQLFSSSIYSIILLLAFSAWVDLARIVRSELQRVKAMTYMEAAVMSGIDGFRLLIKQVLPNIWPTVLVYMLFTFSSNIAIEAGLSFLGFGLPATIKTLGGLIAEGKNNFEAWWMILFPGIWLSMLIYALFSLSNRLREN